MSMISEQVRQIREWANGYKTGVEHWMGTEKILLRAADTIEAMSKKARDREWISVDERLPEEGVEVLVWLERFRYGDYNCMVQEYGIGVRMWDHLIVTAGGGVGEKWLAWQPLPEPYQKSED